MNLNFHRLPPHALPAYPTSLCHIPPLQSLLLFQLPQLHLFHLITSTWSSHRLPGRYAPRHHPILHYEPSINAVIVYGGMVEGIGSVDTFDVLFVDEWKMKRLLLKSPIPMGRYLHSMTRMANGTVYIFGGVHNTSAMKKEVLLGDLWAITGLDRVRNTSTIEIVGATATEVRGKGQPPTPRYAHQAFAYTNRLYIVGGLGQPYEPQLTIHQFNNMKLSWTRHTIPTTPQLSGLNLLRNPGQEDQLYIFGGADRNGASNRNVYALGVEGSGVQVRKLGKLASHISEAVVSNCCEVPFNQVCGICLQYSNNGMGTLHKVELMNQQPQSDMGLEQYLKYIKNQQLLSQQLLKKVANLEHLQKQIQDYTSTLLREYHASGQINQKIEKQKSQQIDNCVQLKQQYQQINKYYEENLEELARARLELARVNEHFEGYIETERDQQQQ